MDHQAVAQLLGNYGEFIGAIAVVATLGYLAVQVRQNTHALRSNERQAKVELSQNRAATIANMQLAIVNNPELAAMMAKVDAAESIREGFRSLGDAERVRYFRYFMASWNILDANSYMRETGMLDDEQIEYQLMSSIRYFYPYWEALGMTKGEHALGRPGFRQTIEQSLDGAK